jgi:ATP-dependent Clp protease ATP-binding subunit ClpB
VLLCLITLQAAASDRAAKARLQGLDSELSKLKGEQKTISDRWRLEKDEMNKLQYYKEEIDRVNLEIQQAERDYDLNR